MWNLKDITSFKQARTWVGRLRAKLWSLSKEMLAVHKPRQVHNLQQLAPLSAYAILPTR